MTKTTHPPSALVPAPRRAVAPAPTVQMNEQTTSVNQNRRGSQRCRVFDAAPFVYHSRSLKVARWRPPESGLKTRNAPGRRPPQA